MPPATAQPCRQTPAAVRVDPPWRKVFNLAAFHRLNGVAEPAVLTCDVLDEAGSNTIGGISGVMHDRCFTSGYSAPFGGFDFSSEHETAENIARTVTDALEQITALGAETVRLRLPPLSYSANEAMTQFSLLNSGFAIERCELNQCLPISEWTSMADFTSRLRPPAQKTLRYLLTQDLEFRLVTEEVRFRLAYSLLAENRARKGRRLALSIDYLLAAQQALGSRIRMYELSQGANLLAAALVYLVAPGRGLVVAWGDGAHTLKRSPMLVLARHLIEEALSEGLSILDLGISNEPEAAPTGGLTPNYGLVRFKRSALAKIEPRLTLTRGIA